MQLSDLPVETPYQQPEHHSALHLYPIQVAFPAKRREVFGNLRHAGIGVNVHYIPVHTQPDYQCLGFQAGQFPVAESYYERAISLPIFPTLTEAQQDTVLTVLGEAVA
jgi:dTDP-4-amino-4,6-dideoxygalactose transaminase